jgi:hypothetical protein
MRHSLAILFLLYLASVICFLKYPRGSLRSVSFRAYASSHASTFCMNDILRWMERRCLLCKKNIRPTPHALSPVIAKPKQHLNSLSISDLRNLASPEISVVENFVIDEWTDFTDESLFLISTIIRKTENLHILTDSPLVELIFYHISFLPAKRLITSVKLYYLPYLPGLISLTLLGSEAIENLNPIESQFLASIRNFHILTIFGAKSVIFDETLSSFQNLSVITLHDCAFVDLSNFYNRNLKRILIEDFHTIRLRPYLLPAKDHLNHIQPKFLEPYSIMSPGLKSKPIILEMKGEVLPDGGYKKVWEIV